jgi:hypothetical protein
VTPATNFAGQLTVPITVSDGAADSATFELQIEVTPVNDPPVINGQNSLQTSERTPLAIEPGDLRVDDPDNEIADLTIAVQDGAGYQRVNNTITPEPGVVGDLRVNVVASDGELQSETFGLRVVVTADVTPPQLTLLGSPTTTLLVGSTYQDAGATAVDDIDGNITERIVTDNRVDTSRVGTYSVTYTVSDLAGNVSTIARTVIINPRPSSPSRGGGGSTDLALLLLVLVTSLGRTFGWYRGSVQRPWI